jgi:acyl dehydratase
VLTAKELREFAAAYDPQPIHLDPQAAANGPFGDVIASGFQTVALAWRLWVEAGMDDHGRGGISLTDVRWHRPVYTGTELSCAVHIEHTRITRQGKGLAVMKFEVFEVADGQERLVAEFSSTGLFARMAEEADAEAVAG